MLTAIPNVKSVDVFGRRELLQIGSSTFFGLTLPDLLARRVAASDADVRAKSVVLVFLTGGAAHIDMFDPKPEVAEVRGEFQTIGTRIPGVHFTEMLPRLADRADRLAVVRSMSHRDTRHLSGTHHTLTGVIQPFRGNSNQDKSLNRDDWPCYGAMVQYLRPERDGTPSQVILPNPLIEGTLVWPAQHAGFLGAKFDPFQLRDDPNKDDFHVSGLRLPEGLSVGRLDERFRLLNEMNQRRPGLSESPGGRQFTNQQQAAYSMLTSGRLARAFRIQSESPKDRERYGRHTFGQSLLLARRLVEAEVPLIQCNMGRVQAWDTHTNHFPRMKNMLPQLDQGVSALLDDLSDRGLLDQTLVIIVGEFGRTPKISLPQSKTAAGRDHWPSAYTAVFAGGGVRGGQVIGRTDHIGGYPVTPPFHPDDMGATIYSVLGIDPASEIHDHLGRPMRINRGKVMDALFSGASA